MTSTIDIASLDNLNVNSYNFDIDRIKYLNYKIKSVETPTISLGVAESGTPFQKMKVPGDNVEFGNVSITFLVDEHLYNYNMLFRWMQGLGFPDSFEQFKELQGKGKERESRSYTNKTSDITLHLLTNHRNSNRIMKFHSAFPVSLSGISLNNSNTESETIEATAEFAFTEMEFIL